MQYIQVQTYDKEKYDATGRGGVTHRIKTDGKTDDEIKYETQMIKKAQTAKNKAYMTHKTGQTSNKITRHIQHNNKPPLILDENTGNTSVLFGSSKTGKTTLMMRLYNDYYDRKNTLATLFAKNSHLDIYKDKYLLISSTMNDNTGKYIDWQRKINKQYKNKFEFLNMFDDFIELRYSSLINNLILTYRNSHISSIICLQYVNLLSKQARANVNNVFLFRINSDEAIEGAIKVYCLAKFKHMGIDKDEYIKFYRDMTADHNYIYIHPASGRFYFSYSDEWI